MTTKPRKLRTDIAWSAPDRITIKGHDLIRDIGVMARAIGLVGHIREEMREPMAREIKMRAEDEATRHLRGARPASDR